MALQIRRAVAALILWLPAIGFAQSWKPSGAVWGNNFDRDENIVWGNGEIGFVDDNIVWGNMVEWDGDGDNIVWGNPADDNVVWGNSCDAGCEDADNTVWGNSVLLAG